jgi:hypothetical protein
VANEELIVSELGQIGTQFDAFAHQMWGDSFYNCFKLGDIGTRSGIKKLGVENVGSLMTRGLLIDVAGLKGVDMLPSSSNITPDDLQALAKTNQKIEPGVRDGADVFKPSISSPLSIHTPTRRETASGVRRVRPLTACKTSADRRFREHDKSQPNLR